ncbi:hypothetical protein EUX98_g2820 [Antrodiella citrinella]|uniref:PNK FHA domain-containing protein n=1 Tax=Antrodiella citrinella TaxID=2447956 RepID=A0A4S4N0Y4_9APHY|nr:hypothetical protein EUX98_g2820 [Antrodiella citrinella]
MIFTAYVILRQIISRWKAWEPSRRSQSSSKLIRLRRELGEGVYGDCACMRTSQPPVDAPAHSKPVEQGRWDFMRSIHMFSVPEAFMTAKKESAKSSETGHNGGIRTAVNTLQAYPIHPVSGIYTWIRNGFSTRAKSRCQWFPIAKTTSAGRSICDRSIEKDHKGVSHLRQTRDGCTNRFKLSLASLVSKVACFDLDGCLIESSFGTGKKAMRGSSSSAPAFKWWRPVVSAKLKEVHDHGYTVVIITNQALRGKTAIADWKLKIPVFAAALPEVPFHIYAATAKDKYRKPIPGMWYELEAEFGKDNVHIDKKQSFFIGDAAGRKSDHAGTDRKWALNVDIPFLTPEEYFLKLPAAKYELKGFHVSSLPQNLPAIVPSTPLIQTSSPKKQEIVLFVGFPSLGKSSFYRKHFEPSGYVHVNQDTLGNRNKCIKVVQECLQDGVSCVVDNTNRDKQTRSYYVELAKRHDVPVRCIHFKGSFDLAWHNNLYRAYNAPPSVLLREPKRDVLPYAAFSNYQQTYEPPALSEGFSEMRQVNWVFEGTEEERRRWSMWLQVDGK